MARTMEDWESTWWLLLVRFTLFPLLSLPLPLFPLLLPLPFLGTPIWPYARPLHSAWSAAALAKAVALLA